MSHVNAVISEVKEPAQYKALDVVKGSVLLLPSRKHQLIRTDKLKKKQSDKICLFPSDRVHSRPPAVVSKHCN